MPAMPPPWPTTPPTATDRARYAHAQPRPFWLDQLPAREAQPPLRSETEADLCIVGGGFTGLWAALAAKTDAPERDVVLLEARTFGASGRNGGFFVSSLTHGLSNGLARFPDEMALLERLGRENLRGLISDVAGHRIDCDLELTGEMLAITAPYLRSAVIAVTRNRLAAADRRDGRRGLWLGLLDRLGLGFDS